MVSAKAGFSFEREDAAKVGRFLAYFLAFYMIAYVAARYLFGMAAIELWVADSAAFLLGIFGQPAAVALSNAAQGVSQEVVVQMANGPNILISELCTGLTEIFVIVGAIIASMGISWRKRLIGAAAAAVLVVLLNLARIVFTALIILGTSDLGLVDFAHNILFRVFLFVSIAGIYIAWFYWAASAEPEFAKKEMAGIGKAKEGRKKGKWHFKAKVK